MTEGDQRAIGALEGKVEFLTETWQRQDAEATRGRQRLYEKVDIMIQELARLRERVDTITIELASLKPEVRSQDQLHQQAIGSKKVIAIVWAAFVGIVSAMTAGAVELVHYLWHLPPTPPGAH